MVITIKRPKDPATNTEYATTIIVGAAVASVDIIQTEVSGKVKYWLIISGGNERQWFVAERDQNKVGELVTLRDKLANALSTQTDVTLDGDAPLSAV